MLHILLRWIYAMKICVLDDYQGVARQCADWDELGQDDTIEFLSTPIAEDDLASRLEPFDVIVAMRERTAFPAQLLGSLKRLRLLVTTGQRNRSIDLDACRELGITVCGTGSDPMLAAEQAWALIMGLFKQLTQNDAATRSGKWQTGLGLSLRGTILGLVGLGKLGQQMAQFAQMFGMDVIAWSPNLTPERCAPHGVRYAAKEELFRLADVISVHMVLGPQTRHIVGATEIRAMKPSAYLVNTSRGGLLDEHALCDALVDGAIAGAALDVFEREPLPSGSRVLQTPNLLLSPHVGYASWQNYRVYYGQAVENILAWKAGTPTRILTV